MVIRILAAVILIVAVSAEPILRNEHGGIYIGKGESNDSGKACTYWFYQNAVSWNNAMLACRQTSGMLASPYNPPLDNSLATYMLANSNVQAWLGARNANNAWHWDTVQLPMIYENWQAPSCKSNNAYCAYGQIDGFAKWDWCSQPCGTAKPYICEYC